MRFPRAISPPPIAATIRELFEAAYHRLYSRAIPGVEIEILSWVVAVSAPAEGRLAAARAGKANGSQSHGCAARVFDPDSGEVQEVPVYWRGDLRPAPSSEARP